MSKYSIKDLAQISGIKAHTIRIWEQRYRIINPIRTDKNIRIYNDADLKLLLNIALLKEHNYKISSIAKMKIEEINEKVRLVSEKNLTYPDQIHALKIAMIDFQEGHFEEIIEKSILQFGFGNTMIHVLYPFLTKIGTLWITDSIGIAQEHFIANLIRQKLIAAIDKQRIKPNQDSKKYILFLPEGELHEIGLLFAHFMLRAKNHRVIYLGQSLPLNELILVQQIHQADAIFLIITSTPSQKETQKYINQLALHFPETKILLSGYQVLHQQIKAPENVFILRNMEGLGG